MSKWEMCPTCNGHGTIQLTDEIEQLRAEIERLRAELDEERKESNNWLRVAQRFEQWTEPTREFLQEIDGDIDVENGRIDRLENTARELLADYPSEVTFRREGGSDE